MKESLTLFTKNSLAAPSTPATIGTLKEAYSKFLREALF